MRIWAEINLDNLLFNLKQIKKMSGNKNVIGVIKANAYGHGAVEIASILSENGVNIFGVACIDEAEELKKEKVKGKILILGSTPYEEWKRAVSLGVQLTLSSYEDIDFLKKSGLNPEVHINIDTGMGRLGFNFEEAKEAIDYILNENIAKVCGVFTHLSSADDAIAYSESQIEKYRGIASRFKDKVNIFHVLNSPGILNLDDCCNYVRPGLLLYGYSPVHGGYDKDFKPVMTLKSKIVHLRKSNKEWYVSYNRRYTASSDELIATVAAGYGDGIKRALSNKGEVIINGVKCKMVGTVCMDLFAVSIPPELHDSVKVGDEVIIIGEQCSAKSIADKIDTISYEILTGIQNRVTRLFYKDGKLIESSSLLGRKILG